MDRLLAMARVVTALFAFTALGSCVRMNEPERFLCASAADCGEDERCRTSDGMCVPEECRNALDCDRLQGCRSKRCVPSECGARSGYLRCPGHFGCNEARAVCYRKCSEREPCEFPGICTEAGMCIAPCVDHSTCGGYLCSGGRCGTSCASNADCDSTLVCDDEQQCVPGPVANGAACKLDEECLSGHCCGFPSGALCSVAACTRLADGRSCGLDVECNSLNCDLGKCVP